MQCPKCQFQLRDGAQFCTACGARITPASAAPAAPGVPTPPPGPAFSQAPPGPPYPSPAAIVPPPPQYQPLPGGPPPTFPQQQAQAYQPQPAAAAPRSTQPLLLKVLPLLAVFLVGVVVGLLTGAIGRGERGESGATATPEPIASPTLEATAQPAAAPTGAPELAATSTLAVGPAASSTPPATGTDPEHLAPDFVLKDLANQEVALSSFRGKRVVLVFWKNADLDSQVMTEDLQRFAQEHKDDPDVALLTVNSGEPRDAVQHLKEHRGWKFRILMDVDRGVTSQYAVNTWPTTLFLDREGVIKLREEGPLSAEDLNAKVSTIQ